MANKYASSCRGCLAEVSAANSSSFQWPEIRELFQDCTTIEVSLDNRDLPQQLCSECLSKCEQWLTFKRMCLDVSSHLHQEYVRSQTVTTKDVCTDDDDLKQYNFGELVADSEEDEDPSRETTNNDSCDTTDKPKHATTKETPVDCPVSYKTLDTLSSLHDNFVVHTNKDRPYTCTYCQADYKTLAAARRHVKRIHSIRNESNSVETKKGSIFQEARPSEVLGYSLGIKKTKHVERSIPVVNEDKKRHGKGPVCKKALKLRNLKSHLIIHTEERPYRCNYCQEDFKLHQQALLHVKHNHRGRSGEEGVAMKEESIFNKPRPWEAMGNSLDKATCEKIKAIHKCTICKQSFSLKQGLARHIAYCKRTYGIH